MSGVDRICPSYITGEVSMGPLMSETGNAWPCWNESICDIDVIHSDCLLGNQGINNWTIQ